MLRSQHPAAVAAAGKQRLQSSNHISLQHMQARFYRLVMIIMIIRIELIESMPARARCVWSKSDLARQTCPEQVERGGKYTDSERQC